MDLTSRQTVKALLEKYNIRPSKKLGQNFLIRKNILDRIVQAARLTKKDIVLEVGSGMGALTQELAKVAGKVIAIEKDKKLALMLKQEISEYQNVEMLEADIMINSHLLLIINNKLSIINDKLSMINRYKVVANLPYNIALAVIRKFVEIEHPPKMMILMLQKEVAQKICAKKSSLPKIAIQFYANSEILFYVPKKSFLPMPKVDGAVIKIFDIQKNIPKVDKNLFFKILKAGFTHPRKTILNNLCLSLKLKKEKTNYWLKTSKINSQKRPEDLALKDWLSLTRNSKLLFNMIQ